MDQKTAESIVASSSLLKRVTQVEFLDEGYSDEKKYVLWESDQPKYLLRLSSVEVAPRRETDFNMLRTLAAAGIRCSTPYLFGITQNGETCYSVLSFIPGRSAEKELPLLNKQRQYQIGLDAGQELRKLHAFGHPNQGTDYAARRVAKYERYARAAHDLRLTYSHQAEVRHYIEQRLQLLGRYPIGLQHDDYHAGNLIVCDGEFAGVVDFNRCDWGDPIEDFYKAPWFSAPISLPFVRGQIDGYQDDGRVEDFWRRYNLFVAMSFDSSLVWVHRYYPETTGLWLKRIDEIILTHDFENDGPPVWYEGDAKLLDSFEDERGAG